MLKALPVLLLLLAGCRPDRDLAQYTVEDPKSSLTAHIRAGIPNHASQLKSGFHQIEEGGWRWVASKFSAEIKAPFGSQKLGATLTLHGNLPELVFGRTGPIHLSARLNQTALPAQLIKTAGDFVYSVEVPAAALAAEQIIVEFSADKSIPPNTFPGDGRELSLIVATISLDTRK